VAKLRAKQLVRMTVNRMRPLRPTGIAPPSPIRMTVHTAASVGSAATVYSFQTSSSECIGSHTGGSSSACSRTHSATLFERQALLHFLQCERGASCAWLASGGELAEIGALVTKFRAQTDSVDIPSKVAIRVYALRNKVDSALALGGAVTAHDLHATEFYAALREYSALCDVVVHEAEELVLVEIGASPASLALTTFSRFKETVAMIRGFLTGSVALPSARLDELPARAFADLVVALHSQRAYAQELRAAAAASPELRKLIAPCFRMDSPELAELHWQLEADFDFKAVRAKIPVKVCWDLYTEHVNKLAHIERMLAAQVMAKSELGAHRQNEVAEMLREAVRTICLPAQHGASCQPAQHGASCQPAQHGASCQSAGDSAACSIGGSLYASCVSAEGCGPCVDVNADVAGGSGGGWGVGGCAGGDGGGVADDGVSLGAAGSSGDVCVRLRVSGGANSSAEASNSDSGAAADAPESRLSALINRLRAVPPALIKSELLAMIAGASAAAANESRREVAQHRSDQQHQHQHHQQVVPPLTASTPASASLSTSASAFPRTRLPPSHCTSSSSSSMPFADIHAAEALNDEVWHISLEELKLERRIGAGSAGTTYVAAWQGAVVAVKVATTGSVGVSGWRAEFRALKQLRHPNVVRCLGAVVAPPTYCLVLEYCAGGDLRQALGAPTPAGFFWMVADGVAAGMAYLHRKGIMHRDLKSSNILLGESGGVKVTDFGLSVIENTTRPETQGEEIGTFRWMAPEVCRRESYRKSADVYSFGIVLWELLTHDVPFRTFTALQAATAVAIQGLRPPLPPDTPEQLAALVRKAWSGSPAERPAFTEVMTTLSNLQRTLLTVDELKWIDEPRGHPAPKD